MIEIELRNGKRMPLLGIGTSRAVDPKSAVEIALDVGYRLIDTARFYRNEQKIGEAIGAKISDGTVKREDLFVVTKLHNQYMHRNEIVPCLKQSLAALNLDYIDLYLVHFPMAFQRFDGEEIHFPMSETGQYLFENVDILEVWSGMEDAYRAGLAKAIGLSNFNSKQIQRIFDFGTVKPSNLQVECHVFWPQFELQNFCSKLGIAMTAFAPFASPGRDLVKRSGFPMPLEDPLVAELAEKHQKLPAQILLRYLIERGIGAIPKSSDPGRIRQNFEIFDFQLDSEDMEKLKKIETRVRTFEWPYLSAHPNYPFHESF